MLSCCSDYPYIIPISPYKLLYYPIESLYPTYIAAVNLIVAFIWGMHWTVSGGTTLVVLEDCAEMGWDATASLRFWGLGLRV